MNRILSFFVILVLVFPAVTAQIGDESVLMTIHDREITLGEFERIYRKNNTAAAIEQQSVGEYLDLFINFKLKVIEAEEQGLDTTEAFIREFSGYRSQLAKPYLSDKEEVEFLKREAFERARKERYARHILIRLSEDASPEDTTLAWEKTIGIRNRILAGEDFGVIARATSDDPSAKNNSGDLGWVTVFRMTYPLETAAYNLPVGEISQPVRTRFGYHLVRIEDERPARGEVQAAHIMVMVPESMTDEQKARAREKIFSLYDSLKSGMEFSEVASRYSEDRGSATRGGELPWFGTGRMVPEFEDAAFSLESIGDVSEPIRTSFGWHIIRLLDKKVYDDYEKMEADLQNNVTKSDRNQFARKAMIERMKDEYDFSESPGNLEAFYHLVDSTIFFRKWDPEHAEGLDGRLFTIGSRTLGQDAFTGYLNRNQGGRQINIEVFVNNAYKRFLEENVLKYAEDLLPEKHPEFRHLVQEYHDGILLFDLTDRMVWSRAVSDTVGLEAYYKKNREKYMWEQRMEATLYTCRDREVAAFARDLILNARKKAPDWETILTRTTVEFHDSTCISSEEKIFEKNDHALVGKMDWHDQISDIEEINGKAHFIVNHKILKPEPRALDECRGLVTADYQNYLEQQWIGELREKYQITVNSTLLNEIEP